MTPAIELIGIDKRFGSVHANKDVTLAIAPGSIHGIIGENGAGKTNLLEAISMLSPGRGFSSRKSASCTQ